MNPAERTRLISVLLPVHNTEQYVKDAIQSILDQTYTNFELLILLSATTNPESRHSIHSFSDKRIRLIYRTPEETMVKALHRGMNEAKGAYIARMDSDDISLPKRFEKQITYMENHPEIGMCGTWYRTIGAGKSFVHRLPTEPTAIRTAMLFDTCFAHPTVMFRKSLFQKFHLNYNTDLRYGEDYDLWARCAEHFPLANIPEVLLLYRIHEKSAFQVSKQETRNIAYRIRFDLLKKIGVTQTPEERQLHNSRTPAPNESIADFLFKEERWLMKIVSANKKIPTYETNSLTKTIYNRWQIICGTNAQGGLLVWKKFVHSPLSYTYTGPKISDSAKIFIKCLLRKR